jgi:hypothetical protein
MSSGIQTLIKRKQDIDKSQELAEVPIRRVIHRTHRSRTLLVTPVPMGERRSSGASALHSTYPDESHLLVEVTVGDIKEGCALGIVLEHLDDVGELIAAEIVSTCTAPHVLEYISSVKGSRMRIKWIQVGSRPSSTFGVSVQGVPSIPTLAESRPHEDFEASDLEGLNLTTLQGLRDYVGVMKREVATSS